MADLNDRKNAFENKFALDEALLFKAEARCCKLFALWLAEQMNMPEDEANEFASEIISANLEEPGFDDVKRAIVPTMIKHDLTIPEAELDAKLEALFIEAQQQIKNEAA